MEQPDQAVLPTPDAPRKVVTVDSPETFVIATNLTTPATVEPTQVPTQLTLLSNQPVSSIDELFRGILTRLDQQEERTNSRLDALTAAQFNSQDEINHLNNARLNPMNFTSVRTTPGSYVQTSGLGRNPAQHPIERNNDVTDLTKDAKLKEIKEQMKEMAAMIQKATDKAPEVGLMLEATQRTPFSRRLATTTVRRAVKPRLDHYDGTVDPRDFLLTFGVALGPLQFSPSEYDAGACQVFAEHLTGTALSWFSRLPPGSIDSIRELITEFLKQFSVLIEDKNSHADLYALTQHKGESLRSFIGRFKEIYINISIPDAAAIVALRNALWYESRFKEELSLTHVETVAEALLRAAKHIGLEEEKAINAKKHSSEGGENSATPYCDYHQSITHATDECHYLQKVLMERYKKGAIVVEPDRSKTARPGRSNAKRAENIARKFVKNSKVLADQSEDEMEIQNLLAERREDNGNEKRPHTDNKPDQRPPTIRRINMIIGGLAGCNDLVRAIRDYTKKAEMTKSWPSRFEAVGMPITFDGKDLEGLDLPHNDPLVVELLIGESEVTRILIDTGSSVNVIFRDVLAKMEVGERDIMPECHSLTGFDGDHLMSVGTITLPIFVGGIARYFRFAIIDKPTIYNVILGTPWLHKMKAVPTTYHQCVNFPTGRQQRITNRQKADCRPAGRCRGRGGEPRRKRQETMR
ncbi:PREDICTED: uncharacterized protein LOC109126939 [Camelina sativa]|uniref:Uncharacterized protein LOC109126939 n=1 Tax=Camelina sativa TaxID=90675 RepID=A0ABM1QI64_CAMSA|nr:PREDICTED: uncharacterized protein LOC109126939 [Camelina sativa]